MNQKNANDLEIGLVSTRIYQKTHIMQQQEDAFDLLLICVNGHKAS